MLLKFTNALHCQTCKNGLTNYELASSKHCFSYCYK